MADMKPQGMYKSLYIRKGDVTFWERGEELAKKRGKALTRLLSDLLRQEILNEQMGSKAEKPPQSAEEKLAEAIRLLEEIQALPKGSES